ncbi:HNH endonuclease signature motif containing protein [Vibrio breoganii]|uniref:HNH endonuclease signature motif containing protein n=1 Tax=Vibrio breoganii TaxID=553239 RepID=UPI0010BDB9E4|nr:HNH endonuclease signature motif containing protein [Vibrio breoganii]TKG16287.1 HNH endonuclease [Vibrio breoganii]
MNNNIYSLQEDRVIDYYINSPGVSKAKKQALRSIKSALLSDFRVYKLLGQLGQFHQVASKISTISESDSSTLELLYGSYLSKSGVRKDIFSNELICPGCQYSYATLRSTLDHFLPSSNYPNFYVFPLNLIPTCGDCNRIKNDVIPMSKNDNLPHPYFDKKLFNKHWLKIEISQVSPLKYSFNVRDELSTNDIYKVLNHLISYELEDTLFVHVDSIFEQNDEDLKDIFDTCGERGVREYILMLKQGSYISPASENFVPLNLEYAFFDALYQSDWFCNQYYMD